MGVSLNWGPKLHRRAIRYLSSHFWRSTRTAGTHGHQRVTFRHICRFSVAVRRFLGFQVDSGALVALWCFSEQASRFVLASNSRKRYHLNSLKKTGNPFNQEVHTPISQRKDTQKVVKRQGGVHPLKPMVDVTTINLDTFHSGSPFRHGTELSSPQKSEKETRTPSPQVEGSVPPPPKAAPPGLQLQHAVKGHLSSKWGLDHATSHQPSGQTGLGMPELFHHAATQTRPQICFTGNEKDIPKHCMYGMLAHIYLTDG